MANIEKQRALDILRDTGLSPSALGLRFDRVVVGVLADLRSFVAAEAPLGVAVLVTISAPVRLPAATVRDLKAEIAGLLAAGVTKADSDAVLHGNSVRVRVLCHTVTAPAGFVGFVHNPGPAGRLLDLAEEWLGGRV